MMPPLRRRCSSSLAAAMLLGSFACAGLPGGAAAQPADPDRAANLPPDSEYVVVNEDGHLSVNGERQRYWSVIGKISSHNKASTDALIQRFQDLGFNSVRMWDAPGTRGDYTKGDGSPQDSVDYMVARMKDAGFRIWFAGMNRTGRALPDDANILDDEQTEDAWAQAVREMGEQKDGKFEGRNLRNILADAWDDRLRAIQIRDMSRIATHMNHHTGLRYADDPVFAVWELSNEEWWMRRMVGGQWQKLPAFFRNSLISQWNGFLQEKYGSQEALAEAWSADGADRQGLLEGESLQESTILLAPMAGETKASTALNDANPLAAAAATALEQSYKREDFADQRASDVLQFFMQLQLAHKQEIEAAIKPLGKSTRLSPMIYDTGIGYEIQSQYLHQNADAVSHDAYVNGYGPTLEERMAAIKDGLPDQQRRLELLNAERLAANDGPWVNWLLKPPGIAQGVPWLEHNKIEGMPFLCYETQIQQPAKYRADFPLRLVALASIQDWDWIAWHYFGGGAEDSLATNENHFDRAMDITTGEHPQGYHFTYDEVQSSMMRAAGHMFINQSLDPASDPTVFIYGRESLYDPGSMDYAGSYGPEGYDMLQTVYEHGSRIRIDPEREDDEVIGPVVPFEQRHEHNPYNPTEQIVFDWKKGYLKMDAPQAVAFTGADGQRRRERRVRTRRHPQRREHRQPRGDLLPGGRGEVPRVLALQPGWQTAGRGRAGVAVAGEHELQHRFRARRGRTAQPVQAARRRQDRNDAGADRPRRRDDHLTRPRRHAVHPPGLAPQRDRLGHHPRRRTANPRRPAGVRGGAGTVKNVQAPIDWRERELLAPGESYTPGMSSKPWEHAKSSGSEADPLAARFVSSLDVDKRLYAVDIAGSLAHARMLEHVGLITADDLAAIVRGLNEIKAEIEEQGDAWPGWKIELEDVHMCIEAALIEKVGDSGRKLHTGRSRATIRWRSDLVLWTSRKLRGWSMHENGLQSLS